MPASITWLGKQYVTLLRDKLQQMDEAQRLRVAQYWGVPAEAAALTAETLAAHMAASAPVRTAFDQLDAAEKDAVRAMDSAAHKGWVVTADIRRFAGIPETRVADLVRSLEEKGIAFTEERELPVENPYWGPTWAGRRLPTSPKQVLVLPEETASLFLTVVEEFIGGAWHAEMPSPLNQLESLPVETLRAMAGHYGVPLEGVAQTPVKLASLLQPVLKESAAIWQVINALPPHLHAVLDAVEAAGGRLSMESVRQRFAPDYPTLHSLVESLTERALAFDRFIHRERVLLAPDRVLETIAQHTLPELPRAKLEAVPAPASEERWLCDLYWAALLLVRFVRLEGITRTATTHKLPKRTTTRFMEQIQRIPAGITAEEWLEQNIRYLAAVGVLTNDDYIYLAQKEPQWLQQDSLTQAKELLNQWLAGRIEDVGQNHWEIPWMDHSLLAAGRNLLFELLRDCRPGQWYSLPSLLRRAAGSRPFFLCEHALPDKRRFAARSNRSPPPG
ncbi:MAG TPA: hypothetical protein VHR86_03690, partial [Armatimonadota bacterium]|nr:hypothetical protein [Armatimonadota bacterium]